jgi:phytoene dehydrogenase-like protein
VPRTAVVVGAGPNGLAAAIALAQSGVSVTVLEAWDTPGGGSRTTELTLPGFKHDVCSAVHPLAATSSFLRSLPLAEQGLRWLNPDVALAHPLDDGTAVTLRRSLEETAHALGRDANAYRKLMEPLVKDWDDLTDDVLGPMLRPPRHPLLLARFGLSAMRSATGLARSHFKEEGTRALFTGLAAHANLPLTTRFSASFGLVLAGAAHAVGLPLAAGGSQSITDALVRYLMALGGRIETGHRVTSLDAIDAYDTALFDLTPKQVLRIAGDRLGPRYRKDLDRFRYGPGVFKIDYALDGPVPWTTPECRQAPTVHLGGRMEEIVAAEAAVAAGQHAYEPFVIFVQPSVIDPDRAPDGKHIGWAYCHVPNGSAEDMSEHIEAQIERFAPGFRDLIRSRHTLSPAKLEAYNENYIGGDIAGGIHEGPQLFFRPSRRPSPYTTSDERLFICSSSTPPGAGVHGLCGYHAAQAALRRWPKIRARTTTSV